MLASETFFVPIDDSNKWPYWLIAIFDGVKQAKGLRFLADHGVVAWSPTMPSNRNSRRTGMRKIVSIPMLRNYILIPAPFFDSAALQWAPGFHRFMVVDNGLALIRNDELEPLRDLEKELNDPNAIKDDGRPKYKRGDAVKLVDGVWSGILAKVESVDRCGVIRLEGCKLGRLTVKADQIEPAVTP